MNPNESSFILCEGPSEVAYINILLDQGRLIFGRKDIEGHEPLHFRTASEFESSYLNVEYEKVIIYRVLDSKKKGNLNFKLSRAYEDKVEVINCVTSPEIEILYIIAEGHYDRYKRGGVKIKEAKEYTKAILRIKNPNSTRTIMKYFANSDILVDAILEYQRITRTNKNHNTLAILISK